MVKTYVRAYSLNKISIACGTRVPMSIFIEFFRVVVLFFRVRTRLSQRFGHEPIPDQCIPTRSTFELYHHSSKSNHSWSKFGSLVKSGVVGTNIGSHSEIRCFPRCQFQFIFRGSLESEDLVNLCIRMLPSTRTLNHMNTYHCLGKVQLTSCRGCDLFWRADVETFLMNFEYNVRLSSDEPKHYNAHQPG